MTIRKLAIEPFKLVGQSNPEVTVTVSMVSSEGARISGIVVVDGSAVIDRSTRTVHQETVTLDIYPQPDIEPVINYGSSADQSEWFYLVDVVHKATRYHHQFRTQVADGPTDLSWAEFAAGQGPLSGGEISAWQKHIADSGIHVPPGGLTGQGLVKASDTDGDTEWAESSGGVPGITEDMAISVGPGQDYETLADAFAFIQSQPLTLGYSVSGSDAASFTLNLSSGVHATGSPINLTGISATVAIIGAGSAVTQVTDDFYIRACSDVRLGGLTFGNVECQHLSSIILDEEDDCVFGTLELDACNALADGAEFTKLTLVNGAHATIDGTAIVKGDIRMYQGSSAYFEILEFSAVFDYTNIVVRNGSILALDEASLSCDVSAPYCFNVYGGGEVSIREVTSITNYSALANIPANQVQTDGSAIYDGITGETLFDYGETAQAFADGGAMSVNISLGQSVELTLTANAVSFNILNPSGHAATSFSLMLHTGGFDVTGWTDVAGWFSAVPDLSSGGTHGFRFELIGGSWYGMHKGQVV